jgi:DNA-binding LytR/AlgR family response regulator
VTNGWARLTSGWRRSEQGRFAAAWLVFALVGILQAAVNALSVIDERSLSGEPIAAWEPWTWELTSVAVWMLLAPAIFVAARRLRPPQMRLLPSLAAHLGASIAVSLAHVSLMQAARVVVYRLAGSEYGDTFAGAIIYEYRKDLVTYVLVVLFFLLFERVTRPADPDEPSRIEVRDGSRTFWMAPDEIEWAQAAGNYVELNGAFGSLLHRQTLAALERTLAPHGFVRVQRSRIVRKAAVTGLETRSSGDFEIVMASGARLGGSRRYRHHLRDSSS